MRFVTSQMIITWTERANERIEQNRKKMKQIILNCDSFKRTDISNGNGSLSAERASVQTEWNEWKKKYFEKCIIMWSSCVLET